jgi:uncharacterized damage-inducible protein DinB
MPEKPLPIEQVLTMLRAAPARIAELADGLSPEQLRARPDPDNWSATDVLAHLRACSDVWGDAIQRILNEDHPTIRAIDPRTWMTSTDYPELEFRPSLAAYTTQRAELLAILETTPADRWTRTATLTGAGKPIVRTLHGFAQRIAIHERPHLKQIDRTLRVIREQH